MKPDILGLHPLVDRLFRDCLKPKLRFNPQIHFPIIREIIGLFEAECASVPNIFGYQIEIYAEDDVHFSVGRYIIDKYDLKTHKRLDIGLYPHSKIKELRKDDSVHVYLDYLNKDLLNIYLATEISYGFTILDQTFSWVRIKMEEIW